MAPRKSINEKRIVAQEIFAERYRQGSGDCNRHSALPPAASATRETLQHFSADIAQQLAMTTRENLGYVVAHAMEVYATELPRLSKPFDITSYEDILTQEFPKGYWQDLASVARKEELKGWPEKDARAYAAYYILRQYCPGFRDIDFSTAPQGKREHYIRLADLHFGMDYLRLYAELCAGARREAAGSQDDEETAEDSKKPLTSPRPVNSTELILETADSSSQQASQTSSGSMPNTDCEEVYPLPLATKSNIRISGLYDPPLGKQSICTKRGSPENHATDAAPTAAKKRCTGVLEGCAHLESQELPNNPDSIAQHKDDTL